MPLRPRVGLSLGALALFSLSGCVDSEPTSPAGLEVDASGSLVVGGGAVQSPGFYFLPPLVDYPDIVGTFNPDLLPAVRVCLLLPGLVGCAPSDPTAYFGPGSATVVEGHYQLLWDTHGPETGNLDASEYYLLEILVGNTIMGSLDLDPRGPDDNSEPEPGFYGFRIGDTVHVNIWLDTQVLCEVDGVIVLECITNAVLDENGGELTLDAGGEPLSLLLPAGALPGADPDPILVTLERLDPDEFLATEGVECIPLFDAPQFGPCFRITTIPELADPLDEPALISMCVDMETFPINLPLEQDHQLQIVKFATDGSGAVQALPGTTGNCPTQIGGLLDVPEDGLLRYAALGANWLARVVAPEPLLARRTNIRLGGFASSFSRFRFALPGRLTVISEEGRLVQASDPPELPTLIQVVDQQGIPVEDAHVHFATNDGSVDVTEATTGTDGIASVGWTVDRSTPGLKTLTISGFGILAGPVPEHSNGFPFVQKSITATVVVVGPAAAVRAFPTHELSGSAGEPVGILTVFVSDAVGHPVAGAPVTWTGEGSVSGGSITDSDGSAAGVWTLPTAAGADTMTATVGVIDATFTAIGAPGAAANLLASGDGQTGSPGAPLAGPLTVRVVDQYGNGRSGEAVTWTVGSGGGSIVGDAATGVDGTASAMWTLGPMAGTQSASVLAGGLTRVYEASVGCSQGFGTGTVDGVLGESEWACAGRLPFTGRFWGKTPGEILWMNDAENLYMAVRIRRSPLSWLLNVQFDFDNDGDGVAELNDDAIGYEPFRHSFYDGYLTARCLTRRHVQCDVADGTKNGSARSRSAGAWMVYELSHPLSSGDPKDFSVAPGDDLGFFLTLGIGQGVFANTQVPGFRIYQPITIVGS